MLSSNRQVPLSNSPQHAVNRRAFFGAAGAGLAGLGWLASPAIADQLVRQQKRVLMVFLNGGMSQFESWDPKPGRNTGGPFQAIPTSIPGFHISEMMPKMATRLHKHTAVIRSIETSNTDHKDVTLYAGKPVVAGLKMPSIGSMLARELADPLSPVPHHVMFSNYLGASYYESAGFYGTQWDPINIQPGDVPAKPPFKIRDSLLRLAPEANRLPPGMTDVEHMHRESLRERLTRGFVQGRERDDVLLGHNAAYARVRGLMDSARLFDIEHETQATRDAYGPTPFGKQTLVARRLIEAGVPFVRVNRGWWDHHRQNFEFHQEMVPELDHVLSTLLDDLAARGLLEDTLVVTFSEMGRTPSINNNMGRDHFSRMSVTLSGCGIKPGVIHGETDADGNQIAKDPVHLNEFFATIFQAVGIDHQKERIAPDGRPVPLTAYGTNPVREVLA